MITRLIKIGSFIFIIVMPLISAMGCTNNQLKPEITNLTFETSLQECLDGNILISLGVCNTGSGRFEGDEDFYGTMEMWDESGQVCTQAEIFQFQALDHGESVFPITWRGELCPGVYTLTWGAPAYGYSEVCFEVTEYDGLQIIHEESIDLKIIK
jgi:hypothetical protein